jgi:hypothetical protein
MVSGATKGVSMGAWVHYRLVLSLEWAKMEYMPLCGVGIHIFPFLVEGELAC